MGRIKTPTFVFLLAFGTLSDISSCYFTCLPSQACSLTLLQAAHRGITRAARLSRLNRCYSDWHINKSCLHLKGMLLILALLLTFKETGHVLELLSLHFISNLGFFKKILITQKKTEFFLSHKLLYFPSGHWHLLKDHLPFPSPKVYWHQIWIFSKFNNIIRVPMLQNFSTIK